MRRDQRHCRRNLHRSVPVPSEQAFSVYMPRAYLAPHILTTIVIKEPFRSSLAARNPLRSRQDHAGKSVPGVPKPKLA